MSIWLRVAGLNSSWEMITGPFQSRAWLDHRCPGAGGARVLVALEPGLAQVERGVHVRAERVTWVEHARGAQRVPVLPQHPLQERGARLRRADVEVHHRPVRPHVPAHSQKAHLSNRRPPAASCSRPRWPHPCRMRAAARGVRPGARDRCRTPVPGRWVRAPRAPGSTMNCTVTVRAGPKHGTPEWSRDAGSVTGRCFVTEGFPPGWRWRPFRPSARRAAPARGGRGLRRLDARRRGVRRDRPVPGAARPGPDGCSRPRRSPPGWSTRCRRTAATGSLFGAGGTAGPARAGAARGRREADSSASPHRASVGGPGCQAYVELFRSHRRPDRRRSPTPRTSTRSADRAGALAGGRRADGAPLTPGSTPTCSVRAAAAPTSASRYGIRAGATRSSCASPAGRRARAGRRWSARSGGCARRGPSVWLLLVGGGGRTADGWPAWPGQLGVASTGWCSPVRCRGPTPRPTSTPAMSSRCSAGRRSGRAASGRTGRGGPRRPRRAGSRW